MDKPSRKFNINERVRVRITDEGRKAWAEYWQPVVEAGYAIPEIEVDADGYTDMQLWVVMRMFGSRMGNGFANVIETEIYV